MADFRLPIADCRFGLFQFHDAPGVHREWTSRLAIGNWKSAMDSLFFSFLYVWQGLFGCRPLWRMIKQNRHFFQVVQVCTGPDEDLVWLRGSATFEVDNFSDTEARRINSILAGREYRVANIYFL